MSLLLSIALLGFAGDVRHYADAVEVFSCAFDEDWDKNFDGWPDGWTRQRGLGYPHYVSMRISDDASPVSSTCFRVDLDGGGAIAYSPPIPVSQLFGYVLEAYVRTDGLHHDWAFLSLSVLDAERRKIGTYVSNKTRATQWQRLRLGPLNDLHAEARFVVVGLHVEPSGPYDLTGHAVFSNVWLGRLPRVELATNEPFNLFNRADEVIVRCRISGVVEDQPGLRLEIRDTMGRLLHEKQVQPVYEAAPQPPGETNESAETSLVASEVWTPPIPGPGFYRLRAIAQGAGTLRHERELNLAILSPARADLGSEFGWSLPRGDRPMPLPALIQLLGQVGIHWVKYPLWSDSTDHPAGLDHLVNLVERLSAQDLELVGMLSVPPKSLLDRFGGASPSAAAVFSLEPAIWYPTVEPLLTRLATQVRWWQLGDDFDMSFAAYVNLREKAQEVKAELDRIGQDVHLGFGWDWMHQIPPSRKQTEPWRFLALSTAPPMTGSELAAYLDYAARTRCRRWVVLEPLPQSQYDIETRICDLVERMVAAKIHRAEAIFCPDPFGSERGLMNDDGTPGELLYPWRTTALLVGGATYLGTIGLPGGSPNHVFVHGGEARMLAWSSHDRVEHLYLGPDARRVDLFGHSEPLALKGREHRLSLTNVPTFFTGLSAPIARWQLGLEMERQRVPSAFGRPHANSFRVRNPFDRGVSGKFTIVTPEDWIVEPRHGTFRLAEGEEFRQPFALTLPYSANSGRHQLRIDFEIQADEGFDFSVYRPLDIGLGDVYVEINTFLNDVGDLEVVQRFVNDTDGRVSFRCELFAPERRRLRCQILNMPQGHDMKIYRLENGKELVGKKLWLRASEIGGARILNYRFTATE